MTVANGQIGNQTTLNNAFVSKTATSGNTATGIINLDNTSDVNSGNTINNTQRYQNEIADSDGTVGTGDSTRKVYSSNNIVANGDNRKVAIGKLDAEFDSVTGHTHDGSSGSGGPLSASSLADFNQYYAVRQSFTITGAAGIDDDITTQMSGKTPGGGTAALGVVTSGTYNRAEIRNSSTDTYIEDAGGQRVYGRITESSGTWTLTYYTNEAGTETSHTLSSTNIRVFFLEVFDQETRPTFSEDTGYLGSLDLTADIVDASTTQSGKINTSSQSLAGSKNFTDGILVSTSFARPRSDIAGGASITALTYSPFVKITGVTATTILGIASGSDGKSIILHNGTTQLLTLNNEDAGATASNRLKLPGSNNIILGTDESIELIYESSSSRWIQKSGSGSGNGSGGVGGINFLILDSSWQPTKTDNSSADIAIGDWLSYDDGANSIPIDMTGGSPSVVTLSRTATGGEILNGTASFKIVKTASNAQGEGASCVGYVPLGYRGQQCMISFTHRIISGNIIDGDIGVYVYDVTNSSLLTPNNNSLIGSYNLNKMDVYIPETCAQIRIGFHFKSTVTTALTFVWDDMQIGPSEAVYGPTMTDSTIFIMNPEATTTNPTKGTIAVDLATYKLSGDKMQIQWSYQQSSSGSAGSGTYIFPLPAGFVIDSLKISTSPLISAVGTFQILNGSYFGVGTVGVYDSTHLALYLDTYSFGVTASALNTAVTAGSVFNFGTADFQMSFIAEIPIQGQSANIVTQNATTFRISNYLANGTRVTGSAPTQLGEYRSYLHVGNTGTYTETSGAPAAAPSSADGIKVYGGFTYVSGDSANNPSKYEIFIGKNKQYQVQWYQTAGKTGFLSTDVMQEAATSKGCYEQYDPSTGILAITRTILNGTNYTGGDDTFLNINDGYFEVFVSEKVIPVQIGNKSEIFVTGGNGFGSTNTTIRRFSTSVVSLGSDITYADSATNGGSFTINTTGIYAISYTDGSSAAESILGVSLNSSQLTTSIDSITNADRVTITDDYLNRYSNCSATLNLTASDVIRAHTDGTQNRTNDSEVLFRITRIA